MSANETAETVEKEMPGDAPEDGSSSRPERPWASPRQEPVKGIVQPRVIAPFGKPVRHTNRLDYILTQTLKEAFKHKHVWPFIKPVDALNLGIPHYHEKIVRPMDLKTVELRIKNTYYCSAQECIDDIEAVFQNCFSFNGPEDDVTIMAQNVHAVIKKSLESIPTTEHDMEITWGKKKKVKGGELARLVAGSEDRRKKEGSTVRMSEPPSECGSETSEKQSSGKVGSKTMKTAKRKAESDDEEKSEPIRPHKREASTVKKTQMVPITGRLKFCHKLVTDFLGKKFYDLCWPFVEPVNAEAMGLHDYHKIIKEPMDLSTIKKKLETGEYTEPAQFESDFRLMLNNCLLYNPVGDPINKMGSKLLDLFNARWRDLPPEKGAVSASLTAASSASSVPVPPLPKMAKAASSSVAATAASSSAAPSRPPIPEGSKATTEEDMMLDNAFAMIHDAQALMNSRLRASKEYEEKLIAYRRSKAQDPSIPFPDKLLTEVRTFCQTPDSMNSISAPTGGVRNGNKKKKEETPYDFDSDSEEANTELSYMAKRELSLLINKLPVHCLCNIIKIIERRENLPLTQRDDDFEMEIDFEALGTKCLREMEAFAKHNLALVDANGQSSSNSLPTSSTPASGPAENGKDVASGSGRAIQQEKKWASQPRTKFTKREVKSVKQPVVNIKLEPMDVPEQSDQVVPAIKTGGIDTLPISESSDSDSRVKREKRSDSPDSDSSSSGDEDSEDDFRAANQQRRSGMPPSRDLAHRAGGMGGQPPMYRVPPALARNPSSSSSHPPAQQVVKPKPAKIAKQTVKPPDVASVSGGGAQANSGKTILDELIPEETVEPKANEEAVEEEEDEEARIQRLRAEARRARELEDENSHSINQRELMTQFEYNNAY